MEAQSRIAKDILACFAGTWAEAPEQTSTGFLVLHPKLGPASTSDSEILPLIYELAGMPVPAPAVGEGYPGYQWSRMRAQRCRGFSAYCRFLSEVDGG
jgi:hypothetical protein